MQNFLILLLSSMIVVDVKKAVNGGKIMKRKFLTLMVVMAIVMTMFSVNVDANAKAKIPKIPKKVSGYEGNKKIIKVGAGKVTTKSSNKKVVKVSIKNKKLIIKFIKKGNAKVTVKGKGFNKTIKVNVKKKKTKTKTDNKNNITKLHFKTEAEANKFFDGYGDKYKGNIESYENLEGFENMTYTFKESLNNQWKAMPDKIRDIVIYFKTSIKMKESIDYKGGDIAGLAQYKITEGKIIPEVNIKIYEFENIALIHECTHVYDCLMNDMGVKDYRKESDNQYEKDKYYYGAYGSQDKDEFYAEKMSNETLKNLQTISVDTMAKYIEEIGYRIHNKNNNISIYVNCDHLLFEYITINGVRYYNGLKQGDTSFNEAVAYKILNDSGESIPENIAKITLRWGDPNKK